MSCKNISGINNHFCNDLSGATELLKTSKREESFICSTYWALQMLDTLDKTTNSIQPLPINSRGQSRQGEYQTGTGDDPLWLHHFPRYLLPEKHRFMVGGRERQLTHLLMQSKENRYRQSFPIILIVYYVWVLFVPLFPNALLGFLIRLSRKTKVTSYSRRFLNSVWLFFSSF